MGRLQIIRFGRAPYMEVRIGNAAYPLDLADLIDAIESGSGGCTSKGYLIDASNKAVKIVIAVDDERKLIEEFDRSEVEELLDRYRIDVAIARGELLPEEALDEFVRVFSGEALGRRTLVIPIQPLTKGHVLGDGRRNRVIKAVGVRWFVSASKILDVAFRGTGLRAMVYGDTPGMERLYIVPEDLAREGIVRGPLRELPSSLITELSLSIYAPGKRLEDALPSFVSDAVQRLWRVARELSRESPERSLVTVPKRVLIVTHPEPRHIDDTLAVSLLMWKYRNHYVELRFGRKTNEVERIIEETRPDLAIVVDTGMRYEPEGERVRWYDHHHDASLPCSLMLVLRHEFPDLYLAIKGVEVLDRLFSYIDLRDRVGPFVANERFGVADPIGFTRYIPALLGMEPSAELGRRLVEFITAFREATKAEVYEVNGLRIALHRGPKEVAKPAAIFEVTGADIVIVRNPWNERHSSVIRNDMSPKKRLIDLSRLRQRFRVVFVHNSGFLAVIDMPVEKIGPEDVAEIARLVLVDREASREAVSA